MYEYRAINTDEINVPEDRQRRVISDEEISEMATSILDNSLLHPIILTKEKVLVVGERRLRAWRKLERDVWQKPTPIPACFLDDLSEVERRVIELEENVRRKNLDWKDEAEAYLQIHELFESQDEEWVQAATAERLGCSLSTIQRMCRVGRKLRDGDVEITSCDSTRAADAVLSRKLKRQLATDLRTFGEVDTKIDLGGVSLGEVDQEPEARVTTAEEDVLQLDFLSWAKTYTGPKFNFIHCDFPYGQKMDKSAQGSSSTKETKYEDTEDVYFALLNCLLENLDNFASKVCHIMFWFPMKQYTKTIALFREADLRVLDYPLVWHKSDAVGIVPDANREGRRTYETALVVSRGDRKILKVGTNSVAWARGRVEKHQSEKPDFVLSHFFNMFTDAETTVLDPTCGSGNALAVAVQRHSPRVLGMDTNPICVEDARNTLHKAKLSMAALYRDKE